MFWHKKKKTLDRYEQKEILIGTDRLENILEKYTIKLKKCHDWIAPLGLSLSLLIAVLVSDFRDAYGLLGIQWKTIIIVLFIISFVWLLYSFRWAFNPPSLPSVLDEIKNSSLKKNEFTAVFFIKIKTGHIYKILVHKNIIWNCFFLPYTFYSPAKEIESQLNMLKTSVSNQLGLPSESMSIDYLEECDLNSNKFSERHQQDTHYYFKFFFVRLLDKNSIKEESFQVGGKEFYWKTLDEMESDQNTRIKNKDIISHIRDKHDMFFDKLPESI